MAAKIEFKRQREIESLAHAMQSGVAMDHNTGGRDGEPKHLRVGVNMALIETGALAKLLIEKGVFTLDEYESSLVDMLRAEVSKYQALLSDRLSTKISLA